MSSPVTTVRRPQVIVTQVRLSTPAPGASDHADLTNLNLADAAHVADEAGVWAFDALGDSLLVAGVDGQYLKFGAGGIPEAASPPGGVSDHDDLGNLGLTAAKHTATGAGLWGFTKSGDSSLIYGTNGQFARFGTDGVPEASTVTAATVGADPAGTAASLVGAEATTRANADGVLTTNLATHVNLTTTAHGGIVPSSRTVGTSSPLTGGGALSGNLTLGVSVGTPGGVQGWSANLDSYATVTPSGLSLLLIPESTDLAWRTLLGAPRMTQTGSDPGAANDIDNGFPRGSLWLNRNTSLMWISRVETAGAAVWVPILTSVAIGSTVQAYSATLTAYAGGNLPSAFTLGIVNAVDGPAWLTAIGAVPIADTTATPTASKIPIADGAGKLATGWLPAATTSAVGAVELATDFESSSSVVPTGADSRLGWGLRSLLLSIG